MIEGKQIRAARALLDIKQGDLARLAGVSLLTVKRFEKASDAIAGRPKTIEAIQRALEGRGIEFIEENGGGPGVRLRKRGRR